jgi:hypothetical protein
MSLTEPLSHKFPRKAISSLYAVSRTDIKWKVWARGWRDQGFHLAVIYDKGQGEKWPPEFTDVRLSHTEITLTCLTSCPGWLLKQHQAPTHLEKLEQMKGQIEGPPELNTTQCDCCELGNYCIDEFYTQAHTNPCATSKGYLLPPASTHALP